MLFVRNEEMVDTRILQTHTTPRAPVSSVLSGISVMQQASSLFLRCHGSLPVSPLLGERL